MTRFDFLPQHRHEIRVGINVRTGVAVTLEQFVETAFIACVYPII
jgi:hypothetical protein